MKNVIKQKKEKNKTDTMIGTLQAEVYDVKRNDEYEWINFDSESMNVGERSDFC